MEIVSVLIYISSGLFSAFSINIAYKNNLHLFFGHAIIFFAVAILSIYFFNKDYLFESIISLILFGIPIALGNNTVPSLITQNKSILTYTLLVILVLLIVLKVII